MEIGLKGNYNEVATKKLLRAKALNIQTMV